MRRQSCLVGLNCRVWFWKLGTSAVTSFKRGNNSKHYSTVDIYDEVDKNF